MPSDRSRHRHSTSGAGAGRRPSTSSTTSSRSSRSSIGASVFDHPGAHYYQSSRYSVYTELSSIPSEYPQEQLEPDAAVDDLRDLHVFCEFAQLLNCTQTFRGNEFDQWWAHTISHLGNRFPEQSGCPFCSNRFFNSTMSGNAGAAFDARLLHVWEHLVKGGVTEAETIVSTSCRTSQTQTTMVRPCQYCSPTTFGRTRTSSSTPMATVRVCGEGGTRERQEGCKKNTCSRSWRPRRKPNLNFLRRRYDK